MTELIIRADAGVGIGTGHVMRCLAIAERWKEGGGAVTFVTHCIGDELRERIQALGFRVESLDAPYPDPADVAGVSRVVDVVSASRGEAPWVILDGYHFDTAYHRSIRSGGARLMVIDDFGHLPEYDADMLLNPNIYAARLAYPCDVSTELLLGTSFALLRPEFEPWRGWSRSIPEVATRVLVTMGGADVDNVTASVLRGLERENVSGLEVAVVSGANNPHYVELAEIASRCPGVQLLRNVSDMSELMAWADVAVTAGGGTTWELAFMGVPAIVIVLADNQLGVAGGLADAGVAVNLGWFQQVNSEDVKRELTALCRDAERRTVMSRNSCLLVDGRGAERVVSAMLTATGDAATAPVNVRFAALDDTEALWRLANDRGVRENAFHRDPIPFRTHVDWFMGKLASPDTYFCILEVGEKLAAQIRYERLDSETAEVHYAVVSGFRGRGIGTKALAHTWKLACQKLGVKKIRGVVFADNIPSARSFLKAGFAEVERRLIHDRDCLVFEREASLNGVVNTMSGHHIEINGRRIGPGFPTYIIAEMSGNHGQSFEQATAILKAAKQAGADAVKIQTYTADTLTIDCDNEHFRVKGGTLWDNRTLYELYKEAYTPWDWQPKLKELANSLGLDLFSTPFDDSAVDFLEEMGVPAHKVASFEIVDLPLLRKIARTGKPVIMSTGMATLAEIHEAVSTLRSEGCTELVLLKCNSAYPAPPEEMNLRTIPHLSEAFGVPAGLSDHTLDVAVPVAAVTLGACVIEKHLTLSRATPGPDSAFSLEPHEFREMVQSVRNAEKALGTVHYGVSERESKSSAFRRSLFVVADVKAGEPFTPENVRSIRPAAGLHTRYIGEVLGRRAAHDISKGTPLSWDLIR